LSQIHKASALKPRGMVVLVSGWGTAQSTM